MQTAEKPVSAPAPHRNKIPDETKQQVIAAFRAGNSVPKVAGMFHLSPTKVSGILSAAGAWRQAKADKASRFDEAQIIADYQAGLTPKQLRAKYGITSALYSLLAKNNVPLKSARPRRAFGRSQKVTILMDFEDGVSIDDLAGRYACAADDIRAVVATPAT